jgi:hypothetical protein
VKSHGAHEPFATAKKEGSLLPEIGDSGNQVNFCSQEWETEVQIQGKHKV